MTQFFNKSTEKAKRRQLRNESPTAELRIWSSLRRKNISGYRFRRQYSVGPYVLDFYCPSLKLAVEIDGDSHFIGDAVEDDQRRQAFIEAFGIHFLRFTNQEVYDNLDGVLETINQIALTHPKPTPDAAKSPPYEGGDLGEV
jgi:very-short-patch-repair endonuclease